MFRLGKINWKRLGWAIKEEALIALVVLVIITFLVIPWVLIFLTGFRWWILLYPAAFFVGGVCEKYNGR